jgi:opacity protein-like surface antigen
MYQQYRKMFLAAGLFASALIPAVSQVVPGGEGGGLPLTVGVGYSNYHTDWSGRLGGPMLWADWYFFNAPSLLRGIGIEVEGRDLNFGRTGADPKLRMDTAAGGPIYRWRHYRRVHPYAKFLMGLGSIDFSPINGNALGYTHDTRTIFAPAVGLDYHVYQNLWVRGNYEYQFWPHFFNDHALNPNGFTISAAYDFRGPHRR